MHDAFMAFLMDEGSYRTARSSAEANGYSPASVQQGGLDLLADVLESNAPPKILLLDLDGQGDVLSAAARTIELCGPDCHILFTASQNDVGLYRQFMHLGAADYLVKPLTEELLTQALRAPARKSHDAAVTEKAQRNSKIIPVIGTRGGVGATMLTVNLAWTLAHTLKQHVGLLDLDMQFGTSALALDKEPGRGMRAALEHPERLDGLLIASSMVQESDNLSILCAEEALETPVHVDGEATLSLIKPVKGDFDILLVDMPRHLLSSQKRLLAEAHSIVIVLDFSLSSLRDARRIRQYLKTLRPDLMPVMVANRMGEGGTTTIEEPVFEKNLEARMDVHLPEDAKTTRQAASLGKALAAVAPESHLAKNIAHLARLLAGMETAGKKEKESGGLGGMFKGLMGGGKSESPPSKPKTGK
jgi:pilus assembly protein CpaE